ncbi:2-isopropylmalate synthase [Haemophilus parahaemolyticus]|uniref:2-isopropylmalate synthase n=2 Tax=Haemophilus parahaemolyticus TaxID=735 RepID=A0AAE6JQY8_HAEPH|nr:2-isopropylmalate synthase [Haemophilus parahaemolyticus]EIJ67172.1 2-isopropylmalate synthase [Haemophilus parahaemolyticus HK385]OOR96539.1 2-isopropylmalate synthase [Haemophilus parahaemolyticus]QEN10549.1 2-isopropylmalate synthase [Haemophilus parahaemolyticus]QRP11741.1 2-isopropylmalate synthase [Haemophilus parahaemolyticus]STO65574.1 2-isopropylmalate synthase [Haemophilus parahaemolyticus HK385]
MANNNVIIFDTTLRDGEQALKASLTVKEKLQIALALERLGVDVMEVGFPVSSAGDFESVKTIAQNIKNSRVCALSRAVDKDIDVAAEALKVAEAFRIHTFIATSALHVEAKLKRSFDDVVEMAIHAVKRARGYTDDVEFSCEDAGRTGIDNICRIVEAAIKAGATTVNIPDTVGYCLPTQYGSIIADVVNRVPNIDKAVISVHCHNDLGMATANSLTAVLNGARQIECTINGIGERAGNTALEEVVMAIKTRQDMFNGLDTRINTQEIHRVSQMVSQLCNMPIQPNKAIVGSNAFAHSSGIHQDGMVKNKNTYEIMSPETIGLKKEKLNLTARSGRAAVRNHMAEMGYQDSDYDLDKLYTAFLELADKKGQVFDYDLEALAFIDMRSGDEDRLKLDVITSQTISTLPASAFVQVELDGEKLSQVSNGGNGPVDAVFNAILNITGLDLKMSHYNLTAKGEGAEALGQVDIVVEHEGRKFHGVGLATDIVESSARALIHAINAIYRAHKVAHLKAKRG